MGKKATKPATAKRKAKAKPKRKTATKPKAANDWHIVVGSTQVYPRPYKMTKASLRDPRWLELEKKRLTALATVLNEVAPQEQDADKVKKLLAFRGETAAQLAETIRLLARITLNEAVDRRKPQ